VLTSALIVFSFFDRLPPGVRATGNGWWVPKNVGIVQWVDLEADSGFLLLTWQLNTADDHIVGNFNYTSSAITTVVKNCYA